MDRISEALMHAVLDGEATEQEQALLDYALESDPEARRSFEALREFHQTLNRTPRLEPPPELAPGVMSRLPARSDTYAARSGASPAPAGERWWHVLASAPPLRYAGAFAIGLAIAASVYEIGLRTGPTIDPLQITGSMLGGNEFLEPDQAQRVELNYPGIRGNVRSGRLHDLAVLVFDVDSSAGISLALEGADHGQVAGLVWFEGGSGQALIENQAVWIRETGKRRFALLLRDPEAALQLRIYRDIGPGEGAPSHQLTIPMAAAQGPGES